MELALLAEVEEEADDMRGGTRRWTWMEGIVTRCQPEWKRHISFHSPRTAYSHALCGRSSLVLAFLLEYAVTLITIFLKLFITPNMAYAYA